MAHMQAHRKPGRVSAEEGRSGDGRDSKIKQGASGAEVPSNNQSRRSRRQNMKMGRSARRVVATLAIAGLGLALTACGGDDDDDAANADDQTEEEAPAAEDEATAEDEDA